MAGATSLIELILKKWGDDAAKVAVPATGLLSAGQSEDADAGPMTAAAKALLDRGFTESAVKSATDMAAAYKSREALTTMDIDEFLNLAQKGYAPDKFDALRDVDKFDEVPFLSIGYRDGSDGVAHVTGHEGRHRAMTLKDRGETQIPVRIRGDIRWDQQDAPNFDYIEDWPTLLASQNEGVATPFPFKRGDSNLLDSSDMALRSKYTPPKKPEPKPDNYDTEMLAELLDEFNFERGNATVPMLATTAGLSGAGLLAPLVVNGEFQHNATKKPKATKKKKKEEKGMLSDLTDTLASLSWLSDKKAKLIASMLISDQLQKGLDHAEMPARGIWGTGRAVAGAASGEKPSDTRRAANRVYTQSTDKTLQEAGDYVLKKTGSPAAAAATRTLGMLTDPTFWL